MTKLNLGCGMRPREGYLNIDREQGAKFDIRWDLEATPWPFAESDSVDEIRAEHILEHLGQEPRVFCEIISEMHRILKPGGLLTVITPHRACDAYFGDPTHVRAITPQLMSLFSRKHCQMGVDKGWANTPLALYLNIDLELRHTEYSLLPPWAERYAEGKITDAELQYAMNTYNNVISDVTMTLYKT